MEADMCIFCEHNNINLLKIRESPECYVLCNRFPISSAGHFLIIPKQHKETLTDLTKKEQSDIFSLLSEFVELVESRLKPDGVNVLFNKGKIAGQTVGHFHIHIICRYPYDGITNLCRNGGERSSVDEIKVEMFRKIFYP